MTEQIQTTDVIGIGTRIRELREYLNLNQKEFGEILSLNQTTLSFIENGDRMPKGDLIVSLLNKYPNISEKWLLKGQGPMESTPESEWITLPYLPHLVSASFGQLIMGGFNLADFETKSIHRVAGVNYDGGFLVTIKGRSMEDTIKDSSTVLIKPTNPGNWEYLNSGVYMVDYADEIVCKRIKNNTLSKDGTLELFSDNPLYGSQVVKKDDIRNIGKVARVVDAVVD